MSVRRLHDIGLGGLWSILYFIPMLNLLILIFACIGSKEDNKYGKKPTSYDNALIDDDSLIQLEKLHEDRKSVV